MQEVKEEWKPIVGWEDDYEVSNLGRVRRKPVPIKPSKRSNRQETRPYYQISLANAKKGRKHTYMVHRLVAEAFLGERPQSYHINHKDGDKANNAVENLEYVSPRENIMHAVEMGLIRPELIPRQTNLKDEDAADIRVLSRWLSLRQLGRLFDLSPSAIRYIVLRKTFKHVP